MQAANGAIGSIVVKHDGGGGGPDSDEVAHFVGGAKEGPTEVVGLVEGGDPLLIVCCKEKAEGLDKLCHFFARACLEFYRTGETGNVVVASLVHRRD